MYKEKHIQEGICFNFVEPNYNAGHFNEWLNVDFLGNLKGKNFAVSVLSIICLNKPSQMTSPEKFHWNKPYSGHTQKD